jgi:hypothetical protein
MIPDDANYSSREVCELAGITYRQLDYWIRCGRFGAEMLDDAGGSGSRRIFHGEHLVHAAVLGAVARFGPVRITGVQVALGQPGRWLILRRGTAEVIATLDDLSEGPCIVIDLDRVRADLARRIGERLVTS